MNVLYEISYFITQSLFLFYSFLYCLKKFSKKTTWTISIGVIRFILVGGVFFIMRYVLRYYILYAIFHEPAFRKFELKELNIASLYWVISYLLLASGYYYFERSIEKERELRLAEQEKVEQMLLFEESERQRLAFEQAFIQAQINPHFLYNVLSFLYSEALQYSEKMAESIYILSDIMRYSLQPGKNINNKVSLAKELEYIQNFIKLNQFRFNDEFQIRLKFEGDFEGAEISSMILMTFVENIFKHADLKDPSNPAVFEVIVRNGQLFFFSKNKKKAVISKELSNGIGLEYIKKRLSHVYGGDYYLNVDNEEDWYTVNLTLFNI